MNAKVVYIKVLAVRADLRLVDATLRGCSANNLFFASVRQASVFLANADDVRKELALFLSGADELVAQSRALGSRLEPVRHLRNKIGGHLSSDVVLAAIKEEPILFRKGMSEDAVLVLATFRLVDAAFNTNVGGDGSPRVFGGDTDLVYPPDMRRFLSWLESLVTDTLNFLDASSEVVHGAITLVEDEEELMEQYRQAGHGTFEP